MSSLKKMNSFSPSSPPTLNQTDASPPPPPPPQAGKAKSTAKLSKQLSKSGSISKDDKQGEAGAAAKTEETPEEKFKKFEDEGVTFKAKLIGSELVMEPRGDKMCQNSIQRLKAIIKGQKVHKQRIVMKISYSGVKVFDEKSNEVLYHHEVPQISFIASDDTDSRTFGYVCDVPNKAHQFICFKTNGPAIQVMSILSTLFEAVLEKKRQQQEQQQQSCQVASGAGGGATSTPDKGGASSDSRENSAAPIVKSPFDDDFGQDVTSGDSNKSAVLNTSDLICSSAEVSQLESSSTSGLAARAAGDQRTITRNESITETGTIRASGSKRDIRSYFDDLKDLQISKIDQTPPFHLLHSDAGGDSGILDSTIFSDWGAPVATPMAGGGMSRTNSAAQMSRTNSATGPLSRTNSAGGTLLFEANNPPSSLFYGPPVASSATTTPMSPLTHPFGGILSQDQIPSHQQQPQQQQQQYHQHSQQQQQQQHSQPASQAVFIPPRISGGPQPTPSMMVPSHAQQHQKYQLGHAGAHGAPAGPNAASFGSFFEPTHSNMIAGSAPMSQLSHHQMSQHARFSSSMVAGLHQRLGSSAASIQSTGSAGVLSRQTNPFDDEFFA